MAENGAIKDRIKSLRRVRVSELQAHPKNWRKHPDSQRRAMSAALSEIGFADALLVRETDSGLQIIDGHLRAELSPDQEVPVLVLDVDEQEAEKLLATFDAITGLAEIDEDILRSLTEGLEFEAPELDELVAGLLGDEPAEITEDDPPEAQDGPCVAQVGDVWVCGRHRVVCGDSTDEATVAALLGDARAKMVFADPPYGVDIQERDMAQADVRGRRKDGKGIANDDLTGDALRDFLAAAFNSALVHTSPGACWYVCAPSGVDYRHPLNILADLGVARHGIVWVKDRFVMGRADYHYQHESIIYGWTPGGAHRPVPSRDQGSVWNFARPGRSPEHPTMKPVALVSKAIGNSSAPSDIILDPFLGSGTTLIAAEQLGRTCYGIEIEPRYIDVILQRYMNFTNVSPRRKSDGALFSELMKVEAVPV